MSDEDEMLLPGRPARHTSPPDTRSGAAPPDGAAGDGVGKTRGDGHWSAGLGGLAQATLHAALRTAAGTHASEQELATALKLLCDAAHARGVYVEHLLVLLKETWRELPDARGTVRDLEGGALDRAIRRCIKEYYAPRLPPS